MAYYRKSLSHPALMSTLLSCHRTECYMKCLVQGIRVRKCWANAAPENEYIAMYVDFTKKRKKDKTGK